MRVKPIPAMLIGMVAASIALAGCSAAGTRPATATVDQGGGIRVVASTNVYGDIAKAIGGNLVSVRSMIENASQDPHSYEADAQVQLALSKADVVIENGGGYDDFVDTLRKGANNQRSVLLNVASISGYDQSPATGEFNEHLWYDFPTVAKLAKQLVARFSTLDAAGAATFTANGEKFTSALGALETEEAAIASTSRGEGVAITEPVPLYLLTATGLVNQTPPQFSKAIEEGTDVSPIVLRQTIDLFSSRKVKLLAYNEQTVGPETKQVLAAATKAGIPIVPMTETLPAGRNYLQWMAENVAAVKGALHEN
jgi:zinc/manganese transport system substrate-binding protein